MMLFLAETTVDLIGNPVIQWGFAGFCLILTGIIIWLIKQLLKVMGENNKVITKNTETIRDTNTAITAVINQNNEQTVTIRQLREDLMSRPCQLPKLRGDL